MFELTKEEWIFLRSQIVMLEAGRGRGKHPKFIPFAFTEHGVTMLANVLKSKKARLMSITVVRAFIALKQFVVNYKELSDKLKQIETKYNTRFEDIEHAIEYLLNKDKVETQQRERQRIGFILSSNNS
jgi:hypothetical protein